MLVCQIGRGGRLATRIYRAVGEAIPGTEVADWRFFAPVYISGTGRP